MTVADRTLGYRDLRARIVILAASALALAAAVVLSLAVGPTGISFGSLPRALQAAAGLTDDPDALRDQLVLLDIRLSRTTLGAFVGAALAISGATMQGMFRNPLADPGLIGVSSGAALAAVATIALGQGVLWFWADWFGIFALPVAAFFGGLATTACLVAMSARNGELSTGVLLLAGVAIAALAGSATGYLSFISDDRQLRDLTLWQMGSLSGASWQKVTAIAPFAAALAIFTSMLARSLNGLLLGESEAFHLGIDVERAKRLAVATTAVGVGAAVAVAGVVGFVGLVVPHIVRLLAGPDHRIVLPASALLGATLVIVADVIARMAVRPAELPLGIVMAAIGAPIFLHLLLNRKAAGLS
jgi:iron complex transport system permease protein